MPATANTVRESENVIVPESYVWLSLGLLLIVTHPREISAWSAVVLFARRSFFLFASTVNNNRVKSRRRQELNEEKVKQRLWRPPREQGLAILILSSLWTLVRPIGYTSLAWILPWGLASREAIQTWILSTTIPSQSSISPYVVACLALVGLWCHTAWRWYAPGKMLVAHFVGDMLPRSSVLYQVFTIDEWQTVAFLVACVWLEWMEQLVVLRQTFPAMQVFGQNHPDEYLSLVACAGNIGAFWATNWITSSEQTKRWPLWTQLAVLVLLPLALVELSLLAVTAGNNHQVIKYGDTLAGMPEHLMPHCFRWLIGFLMEVEAPVWSTIAPIMWPRAVWLVYWAVIVAAGILLAPTQQSRVITRKWFHAVAVLLFTPVTIYAPVLQSLGYAIAVAVLIALEGVRPGWPLLQKFYNQYLDPVKDKGLEKGDGKARMPIIISHTALILGCAMPLWSYHMADGRLSPIVPFLGITVLGVGDAMGAVMGKWFGEYCWSSWLHSLPKSNHRTLEGSLCMWIGQVLFVGLVEMWGIPVDWSVVGPPLLFSTFLEAWTSQMDNLLLPLAVTAFYGLWYEAMTAYESG